MPQAKRVLGALTDKELSYIALRTNGVKTPEIVVRMGIPKNSVKTLARCIRKKTGIKDVAILTR
jgi:DNA-binding CsgD family transcriptional regulator